MMTVPRLLIADWMIIFATENTALCIPAGTPIRRIRFILSMSMRSSFGSTWIAFSVRRRQRYRIAALTALEITVAMATPSTVL